MAWLRRHLVMIVGGAAALAIGISLGAGPLQSAEGSDTSADSSSTRALRDQVNNLRLGQVFDESVSQTFSPTLLEGRLTGSSVGLFVLPGVLPSAVRGMQTAVTDAGGLVTYTAYLHPDLVDTAHRTYVETVAASSSEKLTDLPTARDADPYQQISALIARAYVGSADALPLDREAVNLDSELQGAKLVSLSTDVRRRAASVVLLSPGDHGSDPVVSAAHSIELDLVRAIATAGDAVLVTAPPGASLPGGLLADVAAAGTRTLPVSTLNVVDGTGAQVAAVFALEGAANGVTGAFGVDGSQVRLPPGLVAAAG